MSQAHSSSLAEYIETGNIEPARNALEGNLSGINRFLEWRAATEQQWKVDKALLEVMVRALALLLEKPTLSDVDDLDELGDRNNSLTVCIASIESANIQGTLQILADEVLGQIQAEISRVELILDPDSQVQQIQLPIWPNDVLRQYKYVFDLVAKAKGLLKKPEEWDLKASRTAEVLTGALNFNARVCQGPLLVLCDETIQDLTMELRVHRAHRAVHRANLPQSQRLSASTLTFHAPAANGQSTSTPDTGVKEASKFSLGS
jgi:hypothetical protein